MKGVVFTEFLEMVEDTFSVEMADTIIDAADLPSGGIYTSLGTYDHQEMLDLVSHLSRETDIPPPTLVHAFGRHLFRQFHAGHGHMLGDATDTFSLLEGIEGHIHVEVRKLYAGAQLPRIRTERTAPDTLTLHYSSARPFAALAHGLIVECVAHFDEPIDVVMTDTAGGAGTAATFVLTRRT